MPLYTKRLSALRMKAIGLYDKEGKPIEALDVPEVEVTTSTGQVVRIVISKDRQNIEIEYLQKPSLGAKASTKFRMSL